MTTHALTLPSSCQTGLKEWATVLEAMARGEQLVLIRKGGLIEPSSGFELIAPAFVFYPTFEHQAVRFLREPFSSYFDQARGHRAPEGHVRFDLVGLAVRSVASQTADVVQRLAASHIYNEEFLIQRLKWQPKQPLMVVVVRTFRLAQPVQVSVPPHYAGCTSWVALDHAVSLDGAQPVLTDAQFYQRLQGLDGLL